MLQWTFFAAAFLMTEQELQKTGLHKLSVQERNHLSEWVEEHYVKKRSSAKRATWPVLQEVLNGGKMIGLSDRSLWEIDPRDIAITQSWITPNEIQIAQTGEEQYPYFLTNNLTGSTVRARKK